MYYWDFGNLKYNSFKAQEIIEDIFLLLRKEWNLNERKTTKKMMELFENYEETMREIISMKIAFDDEKSIWREELGTPTKELNSPQNPEELFDEVRCKFRKHILGLGASSDIKKGKEEVDSLALFVTQMAVYKFCTLYFPQILNSTKQGIEKKKIDGLKNQLTVWEKHFWRVWEGDHGEVRVTFNEYQDMFKKREMLKTNYYYTYNRQYSEIYECIERAFEEDMETVEEVKRLQSHYLLGDSQCDSSTSVKEIQNMRHLLDIMERDVKGELTAQDKADLKDKAQEWTQDIERLICMLKEAGK